VNVPKLRFKEFDGEWEYHKFSEIVNRVSKSSNSNILPKVEFEDIVAGEGRLKKSVANKFDDRKGTLFQPNNILYGKLRPYLKNWLFPKFQGVALGDFWVFEAVNSAPVFLYALIQSENYQRVANDTAGTKMPRSDWKKVSTTKFAIPMNIKEQEKIGDFFEILDKKIQLQQQKIDLLQEQKKGFLQKLFPKAGETQPEMRFYGFIEGWINLKLGDLGSVAMNKRIYKEETSLYGDIPFYKIGTFGGKPDAFISREKYEEYKEKYPYPRKGDLLISASGSIGRVIEYSGEEAYYQDSNIIWLQHDDRLDNLFLKQFYNIVRWSGIEGTTIKRLYNKNVLETRINLPSIEEQKKIGEFFSVLDSKIKLENQKLKLLQKQKEGFMQQMFI